jgi:hypothetical protein
LLLQQRLMQPAVTASQRRARRLSLLLQLAVGQVSHALASIVIQLLPCLMVCTGGRQRGWFVCGRWLWEGEVGFT